MERYVDLGNGIIRDTKTGLEWQAGSMRLATWQEQMDAVSNLDLGGYTDWRLPTIGELITLIDYSRVDPASTFPGMLPSWYWSSSSCAAYASSAWLVYFDGGYVNSFGKAYSNHARYVRGPVAVTCSPPLEPDYALVCPKCGYKLQSRLNIPVLFCGVDSNDDIVAFCPKCFTDEIHELGIPVMREEESR